MLVEYAGYDVPIRFGRQGDFSSFHKIMRR